MKKLALLAIVTLLAPQARTYVITVDAVAVSTFISNNGIGYGSVLTVGQADETLTVRVSPDPGTVHNTAVPEASTYALAGVIGIAAMMGGVWRSKRSARIMQ